MEWNINEAPTNKELIVSTRTGIVTLATCVYKVKDGKIQRYWHTPLTQLKDGDVVAWMPKPRHYEGRSSSI